MSAGLAPGAAQVWDLTGLEDVWLGVYTYEPEPTGAAPGVLIQPPALLFAPSAVRAPTTREARVYGTERDHLWAFYLQWLHHPRIECAQFEHMSKCTDLAQCNVLACIDIHMLVRHVHECVAYADDCEFCSRTHAYAQTLVSQPEHFAQFRRETARDAFRVHFPGASETKLAEFEARLFRTCVLPCEYIRRVLSGPVEVRALVSEWRRKAVRREAEEQARRHRLLPPIE